MSNHNETKQTFQSLLEIEQLNANNFFLWYRQVRSVLKCGEKLHLLDMPMSVEPASDASLEERDTWNKLNANQDEIANALLVRMNPILREEMTGRSLFNMMVELKRLHRHDLDHVLFDAVKDLRSCKMFLGETAMNYNKPFQEYTRYARDIGTTGH